MEGKFETGNWYRAIFYIGSDANLRSFAVLSLNVTNSVLEITV